MGPPATTTIQKSPETITCQLPAGCQTTKICQTAAPWLYCFVPYQQCIVYATLYNALIEMLQHTGCSLIIIIIIPCKPYLSASATVPHPLGRRKVERLFSLFSV
jgi:hypothetical protein